jgi:transcriptional regulator with XRE-family HTH domain
MARKKTAADVDFGERLKQLRESRSLNVSELAKRISVSPAAIWHWENRGTRPRSPTIGAIADALGVARGYLESGTESARGAKDTLAAGVVARKSAADLSLEELLRAIEAKGFDVYVRSRP